MTTKNDSTSIKIMITGSDGLIGWHLRVFLYTQANASYGSAIPVPMEVIPSLMMTITCCRRLRKPTLWFIWPE